MVKGLQRPDDAVRAVECGADAVIVSNHGGRNLDGSAAPIDLLPAIVAAVAGRTKVIVDSGVRRGSDIVKAVALGAHGVLAGRAPLYGAAVAGEAGARLALDLLRRELELTLGMIGCPTVAGLDGDLILGGEESHPGLARPHPALLHAD